MSERRTIQLPPMIRERCFAGGLIGLIPTLFLACASPAPSPAESLPYSTELLERLEKAPTGATYSAESDLHDSGTAGPSSAALRSGTLPSAALPSVSVSSVTLPPARSKEQARRGLVDLPEERWAELRRAAADDDALERVLQEPITASELAALAILRAPSVQAAWDAYEAARTSYRQSTDLEDLVGVYRSFTASVQTRVGPDRTNKPTSMVSPSPNVNGLSAEVANKTTQIAFERVRASMRDVVARAWTQHADAVRLTEARRILREGVELDQVLLDIQRSHLESGNGSQAGFLAFEARLVGLKTDLEVLDRQVSVVQSEWNGLLSRPEGAPVEVEVEPSVDWSPAVGETELVAIAERASPEVRIARRNRERADLALRLAETMVLPRFDVGSSRDEPGLGFPATGNAMSPRADFGVREAQVQEMRARAQAAKASEEAVVDRVRVDARRALFDTDSAARHLESHYRQVVPLARDSLDAARGAYESNRASYLDLLNAVQRLLDARMALANGRRDLGRGIAALVRATGEVPAGIVDRALPSGGR